MIKNKLISIKSRIIPFYNIIYISKRFYPGGETSQALTTLSHAMIPNSSNTCRVLVPYVSPNHSLFLSIYKRNGLQLSSNTPFTNYGICTRTHTSLSLPPRVFTSRGTSVNFNSSITEKYALELLANNFQQNAIENTKKELNILIDESKKEGYVFKTKMSDEINIEKLKLSELMFELYQRKIIKLDEKTFTTVITQDNEKIVIGEYPYGIKITSLGIALHKSLISQKNLIDSPFDTEESSSQSQLLLVAIIPDNLNNNSVIPSGSTLHINVMEKIREEVCIFDSEKQTFRAIGYLTSEKKGKLLCETEQFKSFQENKEIPNKETSSKENKPQHFIAYDNSKIIPSNVNIKILKGGTEYLSEKCDLKYIKEAITLQATKQSEIINTIGFVMKDLQDILKKFIYNEKNNISQPKTELQLHKEKQAQLKQKEKQMKGKDENNKKYKQYSKNLEDTHEKKTT